MLVKSPQPKGLALRWIRARSARRSASVSKPRSTSTRFRTPISTAKQPSSLPRASRSAQKAAMGGLQCGALPAATTGVASS